LTLRFLQGKSRFRAALFLLPSIEIRTSGLASSRRRPNHRAMRRLDRYLALAPAVCADAPASGRRFARSAGLLATLSLSAACAGVEPGAVPAAAASVEALIGDAACDSDAQCHTIGVGAKACGGPQAYLAWSSKRTDGAALQQAAEREARAAAAEAAAKGIMSNCAIAKDPGAYCAAPAGPNAATAQTSARRCRLRAAGLGGAAPIY
jgi:hypothetical protein